MIQLATGVAFLMSSLYGAGQAQSLNIPDTAAPEGTTTAQSLAQDATATSTTATTTINATEAYVRAQDADEPILIEIARCESTFRQFDANGNVIRGIVDDKDVGVMQINEVYNGPEAAKLGYDIYTLQGNVAFGRYLFDKLGTKPWESSEPCWGGSGSTDSIAQR